MSLPDSKYLCDTLGNEQNTMWQCVLDWSYGARTVFLPLVKHMILILILNNVPKIILD